MFRNNNDSDSDTDTDSEELNNKNNKKNNNHEKKDSDSSDEINNFDNFEKDDDINNFDRNIEFDEFNKENDIDMNFREDIHIHKHMRNARKCTTIINGLNLNKEKTKEFLTKVKQKFGIGGCQKTIEEIDNNNLVFVFMGDYREKIKQFLIKEYGKDEDSIIIHG